MNSAALPVHPFTGLHAIGVLPSGKVVWPVLGGSEDGGQQQGQPEPATGQPAPVPSPTAPQPVQPVAQPSANDRGYPENTPVAEMTVEQQAAYWKSHARKHEDRLKQIDVTPDELARLRASDAEMQRLAEASRTDMERVEARATAAEQKLAATEPELLRLQAAVKAALPAEVSAKLIAGARRIVGSSLEEFEADATDYFGSAPIQFAPPAPVVPQLDQGARQSGKQGPSVAAGRDMWAERHGKKTT